MQTTKSKDLRYVSRGWNSSPPQAQGSLRCPQLRGISSSHSSSPESAPWGTGVGRRGGSFPQSRVHARSWTGWWRGGRSASCVRTGRGGEVSAWRRRGCLPRWTSPSRRGCRGAVRCGPRLPAWGWSLHPHQKTYMERENKKGVIQNIPNLKTLRGCRGAVRLIFIKKPTWKERIIIGFSLPGH